jgi:hypothetical protein
MSKYRIGANVLRLRGIASAEGPPDLDVGPSCDTAGRVGLVGRDEADIRNFTGSLFVAIAGIAYFAPGAGYWRKLRLA